jgi:hypothetical protein
MAYCLVSALPKQDRLAELQARLAREEFLAMQPFGRALSKALVGARRRPDGTAVWEEEDYCRPPLAQEREAVLDDYFEALSTEPVRHGAGWKQINELPRLFPDLAEG